MIVLVMVLDPDTDVELIAFVRVVDPLRVIVVVVVLEPDADV